MFSACVRGLVAISRVSLVIGDGATVYVAVVNGASVRSVIRGVFLRSFGVNETAIYVSVYTVQLIVSRVDLYLGYLGCALYGD